MRFFRPLFIAKWIYPDAVFRIRNREKKLFLTFDDGPDPLSTPLIINILERHNVKALFFCRGDAAVQNPQLIQEIKKRDHLIGNHSYTHLNGWKSSVRKYCLDAKQSADYTSVELFRPPFGKIGFRQYRILSKTSRIFFWDVIPYDFDKRMTPARCLDVLAKYVRNGSVIALHDSADSLCTLFLDDFLVHAKSRGFEFSLP
jgi:peptidoglycan/xylan/chitin deacetylase (PgdA/CDA1 family)